MKWVLGAMAEQMSLTVLGVEMIFGRKPHWRSVLKDKLKLTRKFGR